MRGWSWWLPWLALLAGCAGLPRSGSDAAVTESGAPAWSAPADEVAGLLDYFHRLANAAPEEQRKALASAQAEFDEQAGEAQRLRLALVLALPRAPWRDDGRLLALLAPLDPSAGQPSSPRRDLAGLLLRLVAERQRLAKDEQRRHETALRDEQRKSQELQQKLDALRSIDRDLRLRPAPRSRP